MTSKGGARDEPRFAVTDFLSRRAVNDGSWPAKATAGGRTNCARIVTVATPDLGLGTEPLRVSQSLREIGGGSLDWVIAARAW